MEQTAFNIAVGIAGALGGWWMKAMWDALKELKASDEKLVKEIGDLRVLVAGDYVRHEMFNRFSDAIFTKLDRIETKIDSKADKA